MKAKSLLLAVVFLFVCLPVQAGIIDGVPEPPPPCSENCLMASEGELSLFESLRMLVGEILLLS